MFPRHKFFLIIFIGMRQLIYKLQYMPNSPSYKQELELFSALPQSSISQSYRPSCSHISTRKSTISARGIGWRNGLLLPSKLSYVAFQLNLGSCNCCVWFSGFLFPTQRCRVWFQRITPWFTNSVGWVLLLEEPAWETTAWFVRLAEEMLPCDWTALLSISCVLVVQKSSDELGFLTTLLCVANPFDGTSTVGLSEGLL